MVPLRLLSALFPMLFSTNSSSFSLSFSPVCVKNLMPFSSEGLWLAEIIMPPSALVCLVRNATAAVGMTPSSCTSTPTSASPETIACSIMAHDALVSFPKTTEGFFFPFAIFRIKAAYPAAIFLMLSEVSGSSPGVPLMPSVPKSFVVILSLPGILHCRGVCLWR